MDDLLEWGRNVLASQPFSVLLGAELVDFAPGNAELRIPIRDELKQQHGFVHGGVISYAADNALTYVGGSAACHVEMFLAGLTAALPARVPRATQVVD